MTRLRDSPAGRIRREILLSLAIQGIISPTLDRDIMDWPELYGDA
jgi:hypothetical protein